MLGIAFVWAVVTRQNQAGLLLAALLAFGAGAGLATLTTRTYISLRPRHDFEVLAVRREYRFDEDDPAKQVQTTHQQLKALNSQAQFVEYKYHWTGRGTDHGIGIERPDYSIFGPVQRDMWKTYFVFLGAPSPRGAIREIEWQHRLEDPQFTMAPFLNSATQSNPGVLDLKVTFSSKKLPAGGRVIYRETSASGPYRCFEERPVELNQHTAEYRVERTKVGRVFGLYWQW